MIANVKSEWVAGNLVFYDKSRNIIATWDGTNRKLTFPTGSSLDLSASASILSLAAGSIPAAALAADATGAVGVGNTDGLGTLRVARATFNPSAVAGDRTIAAHAHATAIIPINGIVVGGFFDVITAFDSVSHTAQIAISVEGANDIITAAAVSGAPYSTGGKKAIVPKANTPESTGILATAARAITFTVTVEALTAGKGVLFLYYVVAE